MSYSQRPTRETFETAAVRTLMDQWNAGDINVADFRAGLRAIVVKM